MAIAFALELSPDEVLEAFYDKTPEEPSTLQQEIGILFRGWEDASDEDRTVTLEAIRMIADGFQRRRRRKKK
jgi:hypothetical protein